MFEVEIKSPCENHDAVIHFLGENGAQFKKSQVEKDIYFNHPNRDFGETDEALRLRLVDKKTVITFKGPKLGKRSKGRIEEETAVEDYSTMKKILINLGFKEVKEIIKKRDYYLFKDVEICLDFIEDLGYFVELEIMSEDLKYSEDYLFEIAHIMGLTRFERKSYLELILEKEEGN